jgi:cation transport regulator ChaC
MQDRAPESDFYYFAYGSCMCPVDLKRSLGENVWRYVIGSATLSGYRLGFYWQAPWRKSGTLDIVCDPKALVHGVLYKLPQRLSEQLDAREAVAQGGYRHESVDVFSGSQRFRNVRTYVVVDKLRQELAPDNAYCEVVMRGALTCGLPEQYCWQLFEHMQRLQACYQKRLVN